METLGAYDHVTSLDRTRSGRFSGPAFGVASRPARNQTAERGLATSIGGVGSGLPFTRKNGARRHRPIAPGNAGASVRFDFAKRVRVERGRSSLQSISERSAGGSRALASNPDRGPP